MFKPKRCGWVACFIAALSLSARGEDFSKWVVTARERQAAEIGKAALRDGGNAIDAAIATAFAMAVTHPEAGNIGGGGFIVAYLARERKVTTFDFREKAPAASSDKMYLDERGNPLPRHRGGARAAGVPGTVRGLALAHAKLGKLSWSRVVKPAADLARKGFVVNARLARSLNAELTPNRSALRGDKDQAIFLGDYPESVRAYSKPDHTPFRAGDTLALPDLAATLDRIAAQGPEGFYEGETANLIAAYMKSHGGLITKDDLTAYRAMEREPIRTKYRGFEVCGMGPPSSGGVTVALMLNMLEDRNLRTLGPKSPETLHWVTEAMRRAYFARAMHLGDPDFGEVPVERLTSRGYAAELAKTIDPHHATDSTELAPFPILPGKGEHTTHLSVVDADGNGVALTYTLEDSYGARAVVAGAGFLLNNEMGDFNLIPGRTDSGGRIGTRANLIAPGKRMLSSMTPTVVLKSGKLYAVTGSPGGRTIPNTVLWVLLGLLEFDMTPEAAVAAPRTHHQWFPDALKIEGQTLDPELKAKLEAMGHRVERVGIQGDAHTIVIDAPSGVRRGVPDPRRGGGAAAGD